MKPRKYRYLVGDFETTVYEGQTDTEVWASATVEMFTEDVHIFHSIGETFDYLVSLNENVCIYYHNLKFDGGFWLSYLITTLNMKQAFRQNDPDNKFDLTPLHDNDMPNNSFNYCISELGQWYEICIKYHNHYIEIRDSLKLLPFKVSEIGKAFKTKHQKLEMEYSGFRYAGCTITDSEKEYISNDILVVKEALETMFTEGHNKLTIGSCCLAEFKKGFDKWEYERLFPDLTKFEIDENLYNAKNADAYIRKSYKGGWCYLVKGKSNKVIENGVTADVNSLYPSMMSSESGNRYPVGTPTFWKGNYIPDVAQDKYMYYFVRIRTKFFLKPGKLPCIQIKGNLRYPSNEWLETSNLWSKSKGKWVSKLNTIEGNTEEIYVTLTLTMTDFALIQEQYYLVDCEILDGCYFWSELGLFDKYIEKYKKIKLESTGALRTLAKLFLNNLYGKMASSDCSSYKYAYAKEDGTIAYIEIEEHDKQVGYIPIGSAITSYARNFTIRAAQKNYHGADKRGFIYADTDSIHCDLEPNEVKGITVHEKNFCCWKLESTWDKGIFVRQKTYIEHIVAEDLTPIDNPYYNIKCAGMAEKCKDLFEKSMRGLTEDEWKEKYDSEWNEMKENEKLFVLYPRSLEDFKIGLTVPGKLVPKTIRGGVLLTETTYEMR